MQQAVVKVGEWVVTPSINQIARDGRQLILEPRLIDLLLYFTRHPDVVLSRDELIDNVWTRNIVTNHVVTQCVSELRKSLKDGEEASPEYIITVPKRGYKLTAAVTWLTDEETTQPAKACELPEPVIVEITPELLASSAQHSAAPLNQKPLCRSIWVWLLFFLALASCVTMIGLATFRPSTPVAIRQFMLNPRDIDIRFENGSTCSNWASQKAYVVGVSNLMTTSLNTFSTFFVHDKTNYPFHDPSSSGKTLTISFVNQRHYRAQQCFMSVQLIDNAQHAIMFEKRYFITSDNQLTVVADLLSTLSSALKEPWPARMTQVLTMSLPSQGIAMQQFYLAYHMMLNGDIDSLNTASALLNDVVQRWPDYTYAFAEKTLIDLLRHLLQPFDDKKALELDENIARVNTLPGISESAIYYQIKTIDLLDKGKVEQAEITINKAIALEMSWMNYVLLGKVYEMEGANRLASDAYITAFNLRPGDNTLYWIKNSIFQTSLENMVPYLAHFIKEAER